MTACKNPVGRVIDHYENLTSLELRLLLDALLQTWTCDQRHAFAMAHPVVYAKMNPGVFTGTEEVQSVIDAISGDGRFVAIKVVKSTNEETSDTSLASKEKGGNV